MKSVVVVPTYNELPNVDPLLEALLVLPNGVHVLVVDDGSPDGTGARVDDWVRREPRVGVIHRPRKMGLGTAYIAGFTRVLSESYEAVIQMDADFSHRPDYVPELLAKAKDYDLVIGSRYVSGGGTSGWGLHRRVLSKGANIFARGMLVSRSMTAPPPDSAVTGPRRCARSTSTAFWPRAIRSWWRCFTGL